MVCMDGDLATADRVGGGRRLGKTGPARRMQQRVGTSPMPGAVGCSAASHVAMMDGGDFGQEAGRKRGEGCAREESEWPATEPKSSLRHTVDGYSFIQ